MISTCSLSLVKACIAECRDQVTSIHSIMCEAMANCFLGGLALSLRLAPFPHQQERYKSRCRFFTLCLYDADTATVSDMDHGSGFGHFFK